MKLIVKCSNSYLFHVFPIQEAFIQCKYVWLKKITKINPAKVMFYTIENKRQEFGIWKTVRVKRQADFFTFN